MTEPATAVESSAAVAEEPPEQPLQPPPRAPRARVLLLAAVVALVFLTARSALIIQATVETVDEQFHLAHGLALWTGFYESASAPMGFNDPPLGARLVALPLYLTGATLEATQASGLAVNVDPGFWPVLHGQRLRPQTLRHLVSAWKCLLMIPGLIAAFAWAWRLYGRNAAWLALAMLLVEPTLAAHLPLATVDTLGLSAILVAAYAAWRLTWRPSFRQVAITALACAVAVMCKHTGAVAPIFAALMLGIGVWRSRKQSPSAARNAASAAASFAWRLTAAVVLVACFIWLLSGLEISPPGKAMFPTSRVPRSTPLAELDVDPWLKRPIPAGIYIGSFLTGREHAAHGHTGFLFGEVAGGWWYYQSVLATYKVPLGLAAVIVLGLASFLWRRPSAEEVALLLAILLWGGMLLMQKVSIGFRHSLPAYAFALILACRFVAGGRRGPLVIATVATAVAFLHGLSFHPYYLPYVNFPREKVWLQISDSNLDWGQNARAIREYVLENDLPKPVWLSTIADSNRASEKTLLQFDRAIGARGVKSGTPLPDSGTLIISPTNVAGIWERGNPRFRPLWKMEPIDTIGHSVLVYDLSRLPKPSTRASAQQEP